MGESFRKSFGSVVGCGVGCVMLPFIIIALWAFWNVFHTPVTPTTVGHSQPSIHTERRMPEIPASAPGSNPPGDSDTRLGRQ
jgi:hypothetical protein